MARISHRISVILLIGMIGLSVSTQIASGQRVQKQRSDPKGVIQPFNYEGVQLLDGRLKNQFEQVKDFYLALRDNDILKGFREHAGLSAPGRELGGFHSESGHALGQWLSAFARMYKATGDTTIRDKAVHLMDGWAKTITDEGLFYYWGKPSHYIYNWFVGGLVDMYEYAGSEKALDHLARITDWAEENLDRTNPYAEPGVPNHEWYILSENLYRAYELTGDKRYFDFAKVWEYTDYWTAFARCEDIFRLLEKSKRKGYHAYSHINTLGGAAMAYKVTGERRYLNTIVNAYQFLKDTQLFATGGSGPEEQFIVPDGLPETLLPIHHGELDTNHVFHFETSCGSWAAFKLARYLMTFTGEAFYGDWIERLIYNGVGAMPPMNDCGMIMYGSRYHLYGAKKSLTTVWFCCQGSLPINVADYHNLIYFRDMKNLYVNLFVPSKVEWKGPNGMVTVTQETHFPEKDTVRLHIDPKNPGRFGIKFRVPQWAHDGVKVKVNNELFKTVTVPGKWAVVERKWNPSDTVTLKFDLSPRIEPLLGYVSPAAVLCGPVVMVKTTARESEDSVPAVGDLRFPADWMVGRNGMVAPINRSRRLRSNDVFRPFYETKAGEHYRMYFERVGKTTISPDELVFHGNWSQDGIARYSRDRGCYFEGKFKGSTLVWEGLRHQDAGMAKVSIDGEEVADVDQYGYTGVVQRVDQSEVPFRWSVTNIGGGEHTIKVTILPRKNPASGGTKINVSRLLVYP